MTKLRSIILLLTGLSFPSFAQNIQIKVDNTEPRLGQEFDLTIDTGFFEEFLTGAFRDSLEFEETSSNKGMKKTIVAKRLGPMTIGPLKFEFNGVTYFSNTILINVIQNLTDKEGVWVRKIKIDNEDYIVIEQIVTLKPVETRSANTWNTEWKATEENLVKLIKEPENGDLEFSDRRSGMGGHPDKSKEYPPSVSYSYKFYEIKRGPAFKGPFRLREKHFEKLPKGTNIPDIVID
jgi:hypothetical protein